MEENTQVIDSLPEVQVEEVQEQPSEVVKVESKPKVDPQESFKQLRQAKEKAERERDDLLRQLHAQQKPTVEEDDDFSIEPDALAEGKHLRKMMAKVKKLEQRLENSYQQSAQTAVEAKLKAQYPDFDKIVSPSNIEQLREQYPEVASTLHATNDMYSKAVSAYTMIKKLGIAQDEIYSEDRQRAQANAAKPRPLASVSPQQGDSPLSRANAFANGLTDELKSQLHKEMIAAMKNK